MKTHHIIFLVAVLFIGYLAGVKMPGPGQSLLGKVGLA